MLFRKKHLPSIMVDHCKNTGFGITETMPVPDCVYISMSQHIGAPCKPLIKKGDYVTVGQLIGDTEAFVSAPIHSSVSGTVKAIEEGRSAAGGTETIVVIETDKQQTLCPDIAKPEPQNLEEFVAAVKRSGLVGLGGAAFPTHIKLSPKNLDEIHTLIINGAECEPFITSDHRTMMEDSQDVLDGICLICKFLDIKRVVIGIESNKHSAVVYLRRKIQVQKLDFIEVLELPSRYPKGAERVLVYEATGQRLDAGVLPASLGIILSNVTTVAFLGQYFRTGIPLVSKRVTVDGSAVAEPKNVRAPIGARVSDLIQFCGGYIEEPKKILMGGPMMGRAIYSDEIGILKNNNAILVFGERDARLFKETACINCGRCHFACPFRLMPTALYDAYKLKDAKKLEQLQVMQCMECGSCACVCPAKRPLGFVNKLGKIMVKEAAANGK